MSCLNQCQQNVKQQHTPVAFIQDIRLALIEHFCGVSSWQQQAIASVELTLFNSPVLRARGEPCSNTRPYSKSQDAYACLVRSQAQDSKKYSQRRQTMTHSMDTITGVICCATRSPGRRGRGTPNNGVQPKASSPNGPLELGSRSRSMDKHSTGLASLLHHFVISLFHPFILLVFRGFVVSPFLS